MVLSPPPAERVRLGRGIQLLGAETGDVGGKEFVGAAGVGEVDGAGVEGFGEVFVEGAGFGVEEGRVLGVAVEHEDPEGGLRAGRGGGHFCDGDGAGGVCVNAMWGGWVSGFCSCL